MVSVFRGVIIRPTTLNIPFCPWGPGWALANLDSWVVGNLRFRIGPIFLFEVDRAAACTHAADNHCSLATAQWVVRCSCVLSAVTWRVSNLACHARHLADLPPASAFDPPYLSSTRRLVASTRLSATGSFRSRRDRSSPITHIYNLSIPLVRLIVLQMTRRSGELIYIHTC
jgi:hypothetical protein